MNKKYYAITDKEIVIPAMKEPKKRPRDSSDWKEWVTHLRGLPRIPVEGKTLEPRTWYPKERFRMEKIETAPMFNEKGYITKAEAGEFWNSMKGKEVRTIAVWIEEAREKGEQEAEDEEVQRDPNEKYTYYQIDIEDSPLEWDYTICETLEEVTDVLRFLDIYFDDDTRETKAIVSGIAMTAAAYADFKKQISTE